MVFLDDPNDTKELIIGNINSTRDKVKERLYVVTVTGGLGCSGKPKVTPKEANPTILRELRAIFRCWVNQRNTPAMAVWLPQKSLPISNTSPPTNPWILALDHVTTITDT